MKKFDVGIYSGRFLPSCKDYVDYIDTVAKECRLAYIIISYDSKQEERIHPVIKRMKELHKITYHYRNVIPIILNVSSNWEARMLEYCESAEVIYNDQSNQIDYSKIYPNIKHIDF